METILDKMAVYGVIPVIAIDDPGHAISLAKALLEAGFLLQRSLSDGSG